jgi:hypothetical protein
MNEYKSIKSAVEANEIVSKANWLNAVNNGNWAINHGNTIINIVYRNDTKELTRYANLVPDSDFAEFVTVYSSYLKAVFIKSYSKKLKGGIIKIFIDDPQGFFPNEYDKDFINHLKVMIDLYMQSNVIVI